MDPEEPKPKHICSLCGDKAEISKWNLLYTTGPSKFSLSDILNTLFEEERLPPSIGKPYFSKGFLCFVCKDFVRDLDRLQHQVVNVKKSIISKLKNSKQTKRKSRANLIEQVDDEQMEEKMEVEKIIQKRIVKVRKYEYLVKWKNYDRNEYNTWELADGLEGAKELIQKFDRDLEIKAKYEQNLNQDCGNNKKKTKE